MAVADLDCRRRLKGRHTTFDSQIAKPAEQLRAEATMNDDAVALKSGDLLVGQVVAVNGGWPSERRTQQFGEHFAAKFRGQIIEVDDEGGVAGIWITVARHQDLDIQCDVSRPFLGQGLIDLIDGQVSDAHGEFLS